MYLPLENVCICAECCSDGFTSWQ